MFCSKCGTENADSAKFCKSCGQALSLARPEVQSVQQDGVVSEDKKLVSQQLTQKVKELPKKAVWGIIAAAVAVLVLIVSVIATRNTINLDKYIKIEATGYDGFGTVTTTIDWDAIEKKYGKKIKFTQTAQTEYGGLLNLVTPMDVLQENIGVNVEKQDKLSNGEEVSYTWEVDEELSKYLNCKVKYKNKKFKVSGLKEVATFDAFADVDVTFEGVGPNGHINIKYNGKELSDSDFTCDSYDGLSNGDVVVVSIREDNIDEYAKSLGKIPAKASKEYKVKGLESYLTKASKLNDETLKSMQAQAEDVFHANATDWDEEVSLESLTYLGTYLLNAKDAEVWGPQNSLFLVYKVRTNINYADGGTSFAGPCEYYWYICYDNVLVSSKGKSSNNLTDYSTPSDSYIFDSGVDDGWFGTLKWYFDGYASIDDLYESVVTSNRDDYNFEDNVKEKASASAENNEPSAKNEAGYVLPESNSKLLTEDDLKGLTKEDCRIARNEIYARHGRKFKDEDLQNYFNSCDWYKGTIESDDFNESILSEIEIKNKDLIVAFEEKNGYR